MSSGDAVFSLPGALTRAAASSPGAPAVTSAHGDLTYGELDGLASRVAGALREIGVQPGDRVAVSAEKTPQTVAALFGIMRAGAAYVPIDPHSPPLRAGHIVADAVCSAICADSHRAQRLADGLTPPAPPMLGMGAEPVAGAVVDLAAIPPSLAVQEDRACETDLAYLLYTSGSTGAPKGVMLTHRNGLAFAQWAVGRFGIGPSDRLVNHAPFHFDLSVLDLYGAVLAGARVHLLGPDAGGLGAEMADVVHRQASTVWYSVPSALVLLCDAARPEQVASLRVVFFAGEVFPMKHLRRLRALVPDATLVNLYGPTETNVCTYHVVGDLPDDDAPLPIGRACENQEVFALSDELQPVDVGEVGELWVRGPTVMKGYWGDPDRTGTLLRQNPLHDRFPDVAYRTGDLVRRQPDGAHEFLGRRDHQIKSRGYRIELGEIETALVSHDAVHEAAVVPVPDERIGTALIAVVAVREALDPLALKRHCAARLPRYMIPGDIVLRDDLPHTSTGKIDRQALASMVQASAAEVAG